MPEMKMTSKLPVRKSIRSKMIKRGRTIKDGSINQDEKFGEHAIKVEEAIKMVRDQPTEIGKVQNTRTAPNGKRAVVSDGSVDSISRNMEKRTKNAIRKIGRSIGF